MMHGQQNIKKERRFSLYFRKDITCLSVGLLRNSQVFSVSCELRIGGLRQTAVA
jgi:hypothetical protein